MVAGLVVIWYQVIERVPARNAAGTRSDHETQNADPWQSGTALFQLANSPPGLFSQSQM
jgi:hypothetical protein